MEASAVSAWDIKLRNKKHQLDPRQWTAVTKPFDTGGWVDQYSAICLTPSVPHYTKPMQCIIK